MTVTSLKHIARSVGSVNFNRDSFRFILKFLCNPSQIGSLVPSSDSLGMYMGAEVQHMEQCPILELGPGTGAITNYIAAKNPTLIEIDADFCRSLKHKYPKLTVKNACALTTLRELNTRSGLVISIPLINNPLKRLFLAHIQTAYENDLIAFCIVYTYGRENPMEDIPFKMAEHRKTVFRNFPPAHIWVCA